VGIGIGLVSAMFGVGGGIGLPMAGVIVDNADLAWLFWAGLMAVPAAVAAALFVPNVTSPGPRPRVDWLGAAVLSAGLAALLLGVSRSNIWGWGSPRIVGLLGGGVALLALFVVIEGRTREPLIDLQVLRRRAVWTTNVTGFLVGLAMFGSFLLIPQFVQAPTLTGYGFGLSVTAAGLLMAPSAITMLIAGPAAGKLGGVIGWRAVLATGAAAAAVSFAILAAAHGSPWEFVVSSLVLGIGLSFSFAAMANLIVEAVDPREVGIATGINTIMRTVGGAFGAALVTSLLTGSVDPGTHLPTESAYTEAFLVAFGGAVLALVAALSVPRPGGPRMDAVPATQPARG
jgi:predicted MFS family arabinose efflux permease